MTVNERIKQELNLRGWSQYHLYKLTKIGQSTISKWFQTVPTTPSPKSVKKVAKAFGVPVSQLMGEDKENDKQFQEMKEYWNRLNREEKESILQIAKVIVQHR